MSSSTSTTCGSPSEASDPLDPPQISMAPNNRSNGRNVHIYDANDPTTVLGGLILSNGVTNANFYSMVEILILFASDFFLRDEGDTKIERDDHPLQPGKYYIVAAEPFSVNDEPAVIRTISLQTGDRVKAFRHAIRSRDRRCLITGKKVPGADFGVWTGFEAAHIFPQAFETHWNEQNYGRWITIPPVRGGTINSVQNGLLLREDIHSLFDFYLISINPDDGYKVVAFGHDDEDDALSGKQLDQKFLDDPQRAVDELLRWHFRQAVLINMRGAGEPVFEHDFPPGSDIVGAILRGPKAAERMESELFSRLGAQMELFPAAHEDGIST